MEADPLAAQRVAACVAEGLPATVEACVALLTRNTARGGPARRWEVMTPSRYVHACDLLQAGVPPAVVAEAVDRIHASAWLKKPAAEVTPADLPRAAEVARAAGAG
ncbi:MAG: hypothetical protein EKK55_01170 [Rhodocyclaceae bacterium]|nr:MAG: hypothetical protein EKK55_01170 [Rhodocyclaceae bacterium]